jgi:GDPmannose 4,6-dehydratase
MFGPAPAPQSEETRFHPRSPYACAKLFAHSCTVNYRESYDMFACCGILFNHESPRRGETFVTRKIARAVAHIRLGIEEDLYLGNLDARRDWGYAKEYVEAMWMMLQLDKPDDFAVGTGETHSVREFAEQAFSHVGLDWRKHVRFDARYCRPAEVDALRANPTKAQRGLNWHHRLGFVDLVRLMVDAEMEQLKLQIAGTPRVAARTAF